MYHVNCWISNWLSSSPHINLFETRLEPGSRLGEGYTTSCPLFADQQLSSTEYIQKTGSACLFAEMTDDNCLTFSLENHISRVIFDCYTICVSPPAGWNLWFLVLSKSSLKCSAQHAPTICILDLLLVLWNCVAVWRTTPKSSSMRITRNLNPSVYFQDLTKTLMLACAASA